MKTQYSSVSEDDFEFLYQKKHKNESLLPDYIGILFSIALIVFFLSFFNFNFNFFDYLEFDHILKPYYL